MWRSRNEGQGAPLQTAAAQPSSASSSPARAQPPAPLQQDNPRDDLEKAVQYFESRLQELRAAGAAKQPTPRRKEAADASAEFTTISSQSRSRNQKSPSLHRVQEWLSAASTTLEISDDSVHFGELLNTMMKQRRSGD
jgi:hypothetical protein